MDEPLDNPHSTQDREHDGGRDHRPHLPAGVCAHGVHEKVVLLVVPLALLLHHPGGHGKGGDTRGTDEGVDLAATHDPHDFPEHQTACRVHADREKTEAEDNQRLGIEKGRARHGCTDGQPQKQGNNVGDFIFRCPGQAGDDPRLLHEVAEHDGPEEGQAFGCDQPADDGDDEGKKQLRVLGDRPCHGRHDRRPLLFRGKQLHNGRLDHGDERHVGVSRHGNRTEQVGGVLGGHIDGRRAVAGPDDPDGDRIQLGESKGQGQTQGQKDSELPGSPEQEGGRVCKQGAEIRHGADTDKNQEREKLIGHPHVINDPEKTLLSHEIRQGDVDQDTPESYGNQKQRLAVFLDPEPEKDKAHDNHDGTSPVEKQKSADEALQSADNRLLHSSRLLLVGEKFPQQSHNEAHDPQGQDCSSHAANHHRDTECPVVHPFIS